MNRTAGSLTARGVGRSAGAIALALVLAALLVGGAAGAARAADAQEDPPDTEPTTTLPTTTEPPASTSTLPPVTDPPTSPPPETQPPTTNPPVATTPAPNPSSPATTSQSQPGSGVTTTVRRTTQTTGRTNGADPAPGTGEGPAEEPSPTEPDTSASAPTTEAGRTLPMLVAPTTSPDPAAIVLVESAPVAGSKVIPLAVIAAVGLGGLALVLRPNRGARAVGGADLAASPVLLAGPSIPLLAESGNAPAPPASAADEPEAGTPGAGEADVAVPADGPAAAAGERTGAEAEPTSEIEAPPGAGAGDEVAADLPDVVTLVNQARVGRRVAPPDRPPRS